MPKDQVRHVDPITPARRRTEAIPRVKPAAERQAAGKHARLVAPLDDHALFAPTELRADPVELLERQGASRIPELLPVRYGRMVASSFAFYRGAALIMAADLATTPSSGLRVQLCGDAHLSNFGLYASPERRLVFDLNDFDETLPGPFEWDVKRLATSFEIACRNQAFAHKETKTIVHTVVRTYRETMRDFAARDNLDVWYARLDAEEFIADLRSVAPPEHLRALEKIVARAKSKDTQQAVGKLTREVNGNLTFVSDPPLVVPLDELLSGQSRDLMRANMHELLAAYRDTLVSDRRHLLDQYRFVDMARKVVGVGSVGTRAWIVLLEGLNGGDPLLLQAKEAQSSVLEQFVGVSEFSNHGERVVAGQRLMQAASDIFLGWQRTNGLDGIDRDYYLRQLRDWKGSLSVEGASPAALTRYAGVCGWTLARAHARSGDRIAIAAYLGKSPRFDDAIAAFAQAYADQNERDHQALRAAITTGRLSATEGV